ncbi:MAG: sensor histidine kinase [Thermoguttaceae bacterium]
MLWLPVLAGASCSILPMADRSAALLAEVLLHRNPQSADARAEFIEQLARDPPLVVWANTFANQGFHCGVQSVGELGRWILEHARDLFRWDPQDRGLEPARPSHVTERCADQVAADLELAYMAARLAAPKGQEAVEHAYFAGLLFHADRWWAPADWTGMAREAAWKPVLDSGLSASEYRNRDDLDCAAEAHAILSRERAQDSQELDIAECRRQAATYRGLWLETVPGAGRCLPALTATLARVEQLEKHFQETLETEKLEAMAEFAAGAGHEINNPLAIIAGRAQLFLRDETDPERRRELALMNAQVRRAYEMIADMRLFARPPRPEWKSVDLIGSIDALIADLLPLAAERSIQVRRIGDAGPIEAEVDPTQLSVAIQALCRNSFEAIGCEGRVEIAVRGRADEVEIRVEDDGPGIPPEHRRHLFDPFYSSRQAGRGLGLGLSKCWRIVTGHGGRIEVAGAAARGAVLTITLPRRQRHSIDATKTEPMSDTKVSNADSKISGVSK